MLESHFPGFGDLVLHREVVTPVDIEARTGLTEGNIFAGEFLAPQMYFFRPAPGWSQYATPLDGYYQCGSGTHPGGCVIGSPGRLASQRVLRDAGSLSLAGGHSRQDQGQQGRHPQAAIDFGRPSFARFRTARAAAARHVAMPPPARATARPTGGDRDLQG